MFFDILFFIAMAITYAIGGIIILSFTACILFAFILAVAVLLAIIFFEVDLINQKFKNWKNRKEKK